MAEKLWPCRRQPKEDPKSENGIAHLCAGVPHSLSRLFCSTDTESTCYRDTPELPLPGPLLSPVAPSITTPSPMKTHVDASDQMPLFDLEENSCFQQLLVHRAASRPVAVSLTLLPWPVPGSRCSLPGLCGEPSPSLSPSVALCCSFPSATQ